MSQQHEHTTCSCGCGCHDRDHHHEHEEEGFKAWLPLVISGVLFITGLIVPQVLQLQPGWQGVWMAAAALLPLTGVLQSAIGELRRRTLGENVLLVIAVIAAFLIQEWIEGALVLLLFDLGERLEDAAMDRSRRSIAALAAIAPDTAWRLEQSGEMLEIPAEQVAVGDTLRVHPHGRVPVDCMVLEGESEVDTSALTGESAPRYISAGEKLLSGSVNGNGALIVRAQAVAGQSAAARILQMVEESAARKGRSEKFITRFARVYTPVVTLLAVMVAVLPPLLLHGGWTDWLHRALVFLVASCPCALVISIPLGFYAGIAAASRQGVLLKGGRHVEALAGVKAIAFDKTGTLTTDRLTVTQVTTAQGVEKENVLRLAAALEQGSTHPAARAIRAAASEGELPPVTDLRELPGLGVTAVMEGKSLACGGPRLLERLGVHCDDLPAAPVYLVWDGRVLAGFSMTAELQEGATDAIAALKKCGIRRFVLLTGDRQEEADAVGRAVGIGGEVHGDLLPEDKLTAVRDLQAAGYPTAFVGDGINDAPVLAQADVGLAMGLGSPAAIETADGVLIAGGLSRLPLAVRLSRRVVQTVQVNIVFALAVKLLVLILAVAGIAPMWLAVFADMGVTLLSVFNALRLLLPMKAK